MKDKILREIYEYDKESKTYIARIDLDSYRDVYSEWDYSPLINRDLDDDLLEYLVECSFEIGIKRKMAITFFIPAGIYNEISERRSIEGFRHYFGYQIRKIKNERMRQWKTIILFTVIGLLMMLASVFLEPYLTNIIAYRTIVEGLNIGAWVALWEIFTILFFDINKLNLKIKHYKRLQEVSIRYTMR